MKKYLEIILTIVICFLGIFIGLSKGFNLSETQIHTLKVIGIVAGISVLYCFLVGEISRNNSQMDKLWSVLPIFYTWIIAFNGNLNFRLVIIAILVTFWGVRLTYNFAKKGAYSIKFWSGEEDYRWKILRNKGLFKNKIVWGLFDLCFISFYQNFIVLAICFPAVAIMDSEASFGTFDAVAIFLAIMFLLIETIADIEQMKFHTKKKELLKDGSKLEDIEEPYNLGFNTTGLWSRSRHPNYLGEQGFWVSIYVFTLACGVNHYFAFNWSIFACLLLILLFLGSSTLGEAISSSKYPMYQDYQKKTSKYIPLWRYKI